MRVISGRWKGHSLKYPKSKVFRPTQDRVKEAIFSIVQSIVPGSHTLDLCAGTGGLGIEAWSRGAERVVFVDKQTRYIKLNVDTLLSNTKNADDLKEGISIYQGHVQEYLNQCEETFDIILLDPPWEKTELYDRSLKLISDFGILKNSGKIICEHHRSRSLTWESGFDIKPYSYGDTVVTIATKQTRTAS